MGAHISTIMEVVQERFAKLDAGSKGYLTLKEVLAFRTPYGINLCHLGVLYLTDRNHDGRFTLGELQAFAALAHSYSRACRELDAADMVAGYASLKMWGDVREDNGRIQFIDWAMLMLIEGYEVTTLEGYDEQHIHRKALKPLHVLFDMERNQGVDYHTLWDMMQLAAEEQQLLDPENPDHDDWIPLEIMRLFTEAMADGMGSIMEAFFPDDAELDEVLRGVEASIAPAPTTAGPTAAATAAAGTEGGQAMAAAAGEGSSGWAVPPLDLQNLGWVPGTPGGSAGGFATPSAAASAVQAAASASSVCSADRYSNSMHSHAAAVTSTPATGRAGTVPPLKLGQHRLPSVAVAGPAAGANAPPLRPAATDSGPPADQQQQHPRLQPTTAGQQEAAAGAGGAVSPISVADCVQQIEAAGRSTPPTAVQYSVPHLNLHEPSQQKPAAGQLTHSAATYSAGMVQTPTQQKATAQIEAGVRPSPPAAAKGLVPRLSLQHRRLQLA